MKKIIVFGGGTAGWLTALWAKKVFPNEKITLIESEIIGILGAGEGTVPFFVDFIKKLDIDPLELISKTRGSFKLGISFENWNGDGKSYFHDFVPKELSFAQRVPLHAYLYEALSNPNLNIEDCLIHQRTSSEHKVPFWLDPFINLDQDSPFALHFDAHKLALFLREKAEARGVERIEGKAIDFKSDDRGITSIILEDNRSIDCDFVFDCSGFARLLIGKKFNAKWISYSQHLPMKKAIPYFPKQDEEKVIPHTRAIAMKYGWQWQIPLMDRFGAGYVFDSDFITPDQAKDELDQWVGHEVECPRVIDFNAGCYENTWIKNCVAIGLSSGFTEPLEATSIWVATASLERLTDYAPFLFDAPTTIQKEYNTFIKNANDNVLCFIYYHYLSKRQDSEFWKGFRHNTVVPQKLESILELMNNNLVDDDLISPLNTKSAVHFSVSSWLQVGFGVKHLSETNYQRYSKHFGLERIPFELITSELNRKVENFLGHKEFLKMLESYYHEQ